MFRQKNTKEFNLKFFLKLQKKGMICNLHVYVMKGNWNLSFTSDGLIIFKIFTGFAMLYAKLR